MAGKDETGGNMATELMNETLETVRGEKIWTSISQNWLRL